MLGSFHCEKTNLMLHHVSVKLGWQKQQQLLASQSTVICYTLPAVA